MFSCLVCVTFCLVSLSPDVRGWLWLVIWPTLDFSVNFYLYHFMLRPAMVHCIDIKTGDHILL